MKITFDSKSFLVDGRRKLILSGEVQYFRMPRAEWKQVLQSAKAAGLNAISTYIPWNIHEPEEGKWDFKGERDLEAYLKLCKQLQLLVIAKPGPYIGAEWSFGGFPSWLHAKGVKHLRTSDAAFMAVADRYLDKVLTLLSQYQVNRGGPVFLAQIENEFDLAPQDPAYLRHLEGKFKKRLSLPLYFCLGNTFKGGGAVPGAMLAAAFSDNAAGHLANLRKLASSSRQPLIAAQFRNGGYGEWGRPAEDKSPQAMENGLNEALSGGAALINQYLYFGGTNFGDWAGRQVGGDKSFATTSYDCGAPLSEGLEIGPKHHRLALWCRRAACLEEQLLTADVDHGEQPVVPSEVNVVARSKGDGRVLFLHNPTAQEIRGKVHYEDTVPFTLAPGERKYFPFNVSILPSLALRASTHPYVFHHLGNRVAVVLWGEPGEKLQLFGSGTLDVVERTNEDVQLEHERKGFTLTVPIQERPQKLLARVLFEAGKREVLFLVVNRRLAEGMHAHPGKPALVLGAPEVDFEKEIARLDPGSQTLLSLSPTRVEEVFTTAEGRPEKKVAVAAREVFGEKELLKHLEGRTDWKDARVGADIAEYGFSSSRAWFRMTFQAAAKGRRALIFPGVEDQFALFSRGEYLGLYGRMGKGARVDLNVQAGSNDLYLLVENWGRYCLGTKLGEKKGILMPVYDGGEVSPYAEGWHFLEAAGPLDLKIFSSPSFMGRGWEIGSLPKILERGGYVCARKKFTVPAWAKRLRFHLHAGDIQIQIALNGQLIDQHPDWSGAGYKEVELTPYLIPGENTLALFFKGPTHNYEKSELLFLGPELAAGFQVCEGAYAADELLVAKDRGWSKGAKLSFGFWRSSFKSLPVGDLASAWLKLPKGGRGSVWLNGQALGRHRRLAGPQDLKIPLSWLKPTNDLLVLEEDPSGPLAAEVLFKAKRFEFKLP